MVGIFSVDWISCSLLLTDGGNRRVLHGSVLDSYCFNPVDPSLSLILDLSEVVTKSPSLLLETGVFPRVHMWPRCFGTSPDRGAWMGVVDIPIIPQRQLSACSCLSLYMEFSVWGLNRHSEWVWVLCEGLE